MTASTCRPPYRGAFPVAPTTFTKSGELDLLEHVAGRVPVIVTTTHFSTRVCIERSRRDQALGATMGPDLIARGA